MPNPWNKNWGAHYLNSVIENGFILSDDKKYFKTRNHVYYEKDTLNLLNAESKDIAPGELELLISFLNNNNPNIRDFDGTDDKYGIKAYKNIEFEDGISLNNFTYNKYKIDRYDNKSIWLVIQTNKQTSKSEYLETFDEPIVYSKTNAEQVLFYKNFFTN